MVTFKLDQFIINFSHFLFLESHMISQLVVNLFSLLLFGLNLSLKELSMVYVVVDDKSDSLLFVEFHVML